MTNIGPLRSTFTPAASCAPSTGMTVFYFGSNMVWAEGQMSAGDCFPSSYSLGPTGYYSPGVCPSGYTTACTILNSAGTVTETIHTCCPTALGISYSCASTRNPALNLGCSTIFTGVVTITSLTVVSDGTTSTLTAISYPAGGGIGANGIAIRTQSTDFLTTSSTSVGSSTSLTASSRTSSRTSTTVSAPVTTSASSSSNAAVSHGLSSGASASIGVSIGVFVIAITIGAFFTWRKRRGCENKPMFAAEMQAGESPRKAHEMPTQNIHEVSGAHRSELSA